MKWQGCQCQSQMRICVCVSLSIGQALVILAMWNNVGDGAGFYVCLTFHLDLIIIRYAMLCWSRPLPHSSICHLIHIHSLNKRTLNNWHTDIWNISSTKYMATRSVDALVVKSHTHTHQNRMQCVKRLWKNEIYLYIAFHIPMQCGAFRLFRFPKKKLQFEHKTLHKCCCVIVDRACMHFGIEKRIRAHVWGQTDTATETDWPFKSPRSMQLYKRLWNSFGFEEMMQICTNWQYKRNHLNRLWFLIRPSNEWHCGQCNRIRSSCHHLTSYKTFCKREFIWQFVADAILYQFK